MEQKFFKKLNTAEMLALSWNEITTRTWGPDGIPIDEYEEESRGLFRKKAHIPVVNLGGTPERAIWFLGSNPELTAYCQRNRDVKIKGGNTSSNRLCVLVKQAAANNMIVQIRAQMPQDNDRPPAGIGIDRVPDGANLGTIQRSILLAQRTILFRQ